MKRIRYAAVMVVMQASFVSLTAAEPRGVEGAFDSVKQLGLYNTVFNSPSKDEADSIPLGNGVTGMNLWAEEDGDLLFYISRNDSISEMHRLLKVGRVRVRFSNNPFGKGKPFKQTLILHDGRCEISAGEKGSRLRLSIFIDADAQTVYVSGSSDQPITVSATLENWREKPKKLSPLECASNWIYRGGVPTDMGILNEESADVLLRDSTHVIWYHRNEHSPVPTHIEHQHMQEFADKIYDPILHRTFGGIIFGPGFVGDKENELTLNKTGKSFDLRIATHSVQPSTADNFLKALREKAENSVYSDQALKRTAHWWNNFWNRSWIFVKGSTPIIPPNKHIFNFGAGRQGTISSGGSFGRLSVYPEALSSDKIKTLAATSQGKESPIDGSISTLSARGNADINSGEFNLGYLAVEDSVGWEFPDGFTMEAWINPLRQGRIFDKVTPGGANGMLLDIYGNKLRLIVGSKLFMSEINIALSQWSHVAITGDPSGMFSIYQNGERVGGSKPKDASKQVPSEITQAYILTRYQFACQQRSSFPSHFNAGIFNVAPEFAYYYSDPRGKNWSADYRYYGPCYWWQNTRFMYQLHLAQGNFDLMDSYYDFYFSNMPVFEAMAKNYYNADGLYMNETISLFGLPGMGDFCWGAKELSCGYIVNIWQQALEFGAMALDRYDYTGDEVFLKKTVTWCDKALIFYDTRFEKASDGKIIIFPSHGLETYWKDVTGDTPSIAGLQEVTTRLLALPERLTTNEQRVRWQRIAKAVPELPKRKNKEGLIVPDVAQKYDPSRSNFEAPELYGVFPFRHYGVGRDKHDIEEARRAWDAMFVKGHTCWYQTGIFAARLGLTDKAKEDVLIRTGPASRLRVAHQGNREFRFPGFYSSPHDSCPDYDGAGNMCNTLQEMLLQPGPGKKIILLPAWPKEWNADFKLHARYKTIVEGKIRNGKVVSLKVTPESRKKDIILPKAE